MSLPVEIAVPGAKGTLYTVPVSQQAIVTAIHIANESGAGRTFTIYVKPVGGTSRPISPLNQALAIDALAIYADDLHLPAGTLIEGVASGASVSCLITGKEVPLREYALYGSA